MNTFTFFLLCCVTIYAFAPLSVQAYLDPGTGSYMIQLLVGVFAGSLFAVKIFWGRIRVTLKSAILKIRKHEQSKEE